MPRTRNAPTRLKSSTAVRKSISERGPLFVPLSRESLRMILRPHESGVVSAIGGGSGDPCSPAALKNFRSPSSVNAGAMAKPRE